MKKFIIITTIQQPTKATLKFASMKDWNLIVVGDKKTPHKDYYNINCTYLSPHDQQELYPKISDILGWNTIQRRNIGFIYAYHNGADIIATVDDDNIPYDDWGTDLYVGKEIVVDLWESKNGIFDPLSVTNYSNLWHRGYPIEKVVDKNEVIYLGKNKRTVLVQADLWDGDPDIDAMCRLAYKPLVKFSIDKPYASVNISPFNSQNTFIHRNILPYYMVIPYVGRMDDIWGSYNLYNHFKDFVIYNRASVYQDRNKQDLIYNMEKELIGYRNTLDFINGKKLLSSINSSAKEAYDMYMEYFK